MTLAGAATPEGPAVAFSVGVLFAVEFLAVRRLWVVTGLLGVVVGLVVGFLVGARFRLWPWKAEWVEAAGTWVGAGVTLLAVLLAWIAFNSEEFARRRAIRREEDTERRRLQLAANRVFCDIRPATGMFFARGDATGSVEQLEIEVNNRSGSVVTDVVCELRLDGSEWSYDIDEPIETDKTVTRKFELEVAHYGQELRANAKFTFSMDGVKWSRPYGQPAVRLTAAAV
jgi:hypothetical protein